MKKGTNIFLALLLLAGCTQSEPAYQIVRQYYDAQGNAAHSITEIYNEEDQLLEIISGEDKTTYEYEDGLLVVMTNGKNKSVYDYDENGNLVLVESYLDDELIATVIYEYDSKQNCIFQYSTTPDGTDGVEIRMKYDSKNHLIEKYQNAIDQPSDIHTIYVNDETGKCIQEMIEDVDGGTVIVSYQYDQDRVIEKKTDSSYGSSIIQYVYDEENRLIEEKVSYDGGENYLPIVTVEY